ncbi:MAG: aminomethyl-transferring glycine dehydrogenase subunit GcvPA [Candidatus Eremiobacteraeota bacterium]|nr:aminomethyl-transferring glycine dehydrogenase subunit GcvPA [Candidatus Eremiobacteraeota bacterium]MBV8498336.1 aminomethyl-transferring glycine dehydrogenase subunit GcvPA [Candidatus Eremiobacteraeota bacterium]
MYAPHTERDVASMLETIGVESLDALLRVPDAIALKRKLDIVPALPEYLIARRFENLAAKNAGAEYRSFLGGGAYRHYAPPAIAALAMRGEFLTAYTPYQAEVSQGYLQAIYEWQTYIGLLTGMEIANASVYDGATALAEAAIMALGATQRQKLLVSRAIHPNYRAVLRTYCDGLDVAIEEIPLTASGTSDLDWLAQADLGGYAAVAVQSPNFFGCVDALSPEAAQAIATSGAVPIAVVAEALSLAALAPPGAWGAQLVAGEAQSFGVPVAFGGPYAGFIASAKEHMRRIPGRLVGKTVDASGRTAYVLTLQAREQHIRRERATSNICTNQAHCALIATIYLALMGETGLRNAAALNLARSRELASAVANVPGVRLTYDAPFFNEFVADVGRPASSVLEELQDRGILGGIDLGRFYPELDTCILMTATELTTSGDIEALAAALREVLRAHAAV